MTPDPPPVPIAATLTIGTRTLTVTFDRPLQPGVSAPGNWTGRGLFIFTGRASFDAAVPLTIAGSTVSGVVRELVLPVPPPGDAVNYAAAPPDVRSLAGVPAVAFADFPLTSIP